MNLTPYPAPSAPQVSLPRLSILGQPPMPANDAVTLPTGENERDGYQPKPAPAVIMVGLDDTGKPHASWFTADQADAAMTAADLMNMALVDVIGDLDGIAAKLPQGKLFESGKAFVPFVKRSTYELLATHLSDDYLTAAAKRIKTAGAGYAKASKGEAAPRHFPEYWSKIAVGDVVLASEGHDDGWWQATVIAVQDAGDYLLQWTDWPELDQFARPATQLALLHAQFTTEAPE